MIYNDRYFSASTSDIHPSKSLKPTSEYEYRCAEYWQPKSSLTGKLRLSKLLGRGAFGEVYEGFTLDSTSVWEKVAVKKIKGWCLSLQ